MGRNPFEVHVGDRVVLVEAIPEDLHWENEEPTGTVQSIITPSKIMVKFDGEDRLREVNPCHTAAL